MLGNHNPFPITDDGKGKMQQFMLVAMERNRIWKGQPPSAWSDLSASVNRGYQAYRFASHVIFFILAFEIFSVYETNQMLERLVALR